MTHVRITSKDNGGYSLFVDEHDLTYQVLAGAQVELPVNGGAALVHVTLVADALNVDVDDGIVMVAPTADEMSEIHVKAQDAAVHISRALDRLTRAVERGSRRGMGK